MLKYLYLKYSSKVFFLIYYPTNFSGLIIDYCAIITTYNIIVGRYALYNIYFLK